MNKTFKKIVASVMAVASLAVSMTSLGSSATEITPLSAPTAYRSFLVGSSYAEAGIYVSSSQANASTSLSGASYVRAKLTIYASSISSYSVNNGVTVKGTYVSVNALGSGVTRGESLHYAEKGTSNGSTTMTRNA